MTNTLTDDQIDEMVGIEVEDIVEQETETVEGYTPQECTHIVNAWLTEQGHDRKLPPQMFYNYTRKGLIKNTDRRVKLEDLQTWYVAYVRKNVMNKGPKLTIPAAPVV